MNVGISKQPTIPFIFFLFPANTKLHVTYLLIEISIQQYNHNITRNLYYIYYIIEWEITTNRYVTCN